MNYIKSIRINLCHIYYFFIYSFIGWCIDSTYVSLTEGRFVNRGLLYGPFCPIYGFGALILILLLEPVKKNIFLFFLSAVFLTSALEYGTGIVMEYFFNIVAWDYSKELFNLHGKIALKFSLCWGLLSVVAVYLVHPYIERMVTQIPTGQKAAFCYIFIIIVVVDFIVAVIYQYYYISASDFTPITRFFKGKPYDYIPKYIKILDI